MSRFVIIARYTSDEVRYLFDDARKALRRARALTNKHIPFRIETGAGLVLTIAELSQLPPL